MIQEHAPRPVSRRQAWLALLCMVAILAACAPASASVVALSPPATAGGKPITTVPALPPTERPVATTPASPPTERLPTPTPAPLRATSPPITYAATPVYGCRIVSQYPHDPNAYTQGLVYENGLFYEGTGLRGESSLRKVALETGEVLQIHNLDADLFGEGISVGGDRIWQLTWQNQVAFLYDKETFEQLDTAQYSTEGWGLTDDGERLIMSDGTATLYFRDPLTFEVLGQVVVYDERGPVTRLNELEYIHGQVFANVWMTNRIAIIDPVAGRVDAWLDLTGLLAPSHQEAEPDVLNGIAYDVAGERLFVTGKRWPAVYEIEIVGDNAPTLLPLISRQ